MTAKLTDFRVVLFTAGRYELRQPLVLNSKIAQSMTLSGFEKVRMQHEVLGMMQARINALQAAVGGIKTSALLWHWAAKGRLERLPVQTKGGPTVVGLWSRTDGALTAAGEKENKLPYPFSWMFQRSWKYVLGGGGPARCHIISSVMSGRASKSGSSNP
jgi:hypothetical protein